jgi:hypothetical protein
VLTLRNREDSSRLRTRLASGPKRVVVIGGGGLPLGLPVTLAEHGPAPLVQGMYVGIYQEKQLSFFVVFPIFARMKMMTMISSLLLTDNNVVVELNKNLSSIDIKEVLSNESLSQHIRDALVNNDSNPRLFDLIKKEVREVKQNELELKLITDTPKLGGILDFPKYSTIIDNVLMNSTPQFSIGIFGIWGTGKTTLMKMIQDQLDKDEDKDVVYWNRVSENSEKDKLVSYIKENFNLNWISNINTTHIPHNILVFEHPNAKIRIDEKGTYSYPKDSITFRVNGKLAQIISDDRNINQKLRARSKDGGDL